MSESLELATIWLVDLVGSTRLATSVGPARADELRDEYFALLREAITASGGREFKNTGDGLFVAFSSASAAVECAVLTQQLFERRYRGAEQRLQVRIGLGTGESTVKDGDYFGMPSIEAARLCDKAPTDGILVSAATRMLAGRVDGVRFESVGELELKGIPDPVEAFAVEWEPLADESAVAGGWPLPEALRVVPRISYVGRDPERGLLEVARNQARSGTRQVVLVSGEPGIGKTRLGSYAALGANAAGFAVCSGGCSDDLAVPYEPWIAVCSQLVEHLPENVLTKYVGECGGEISRLASNLGRRIPDASGPTSSDPETERFLLFKAVTELLRTVAEALPLCVVLDDLHWADGQTVALLKHVARSIERGSLLLLVTFRDSELIQDHPLTSTLADLRRLDGVERIALTGWDAVEVAEVLRVGAGHELDVDAFALAGEIANETGGNPFFVGEILRNLTEAGGIAFDEATGRWSVEPDAVTGLPVSVRDVVGRRIERLGADGRELLTIAAVVGRSFDLRLLTELVDLPDGRLLDLLEAAVNATLLRESSEVVGRFSFEHALINHALYQTLGATRRATLHHRVALALEAVYGANVDERLADLALHWRLATASVDTTKAASYSIRAGQHALASLAPSEAAKQFGDALQLLGPASTTQRCEALIGLGEAQRLTGDAAFRGTLLDASRIALDLGDGDLAARAVLANNRGWFSSVGQVDAEKVEVIEAALDALPSTDSPERALLLATLCSEIQYSSPLERRLTLAEDAKAMARRLGDQATSVYVAVRCGIATSASSTLESQLAESAEVAAAAREIEDPQSQFLAANMGRSLALRAGHFDLANERMRLQQSIAEQIGQPFMRWIAKTVEVSVAIWHGSPNEAEQLADAALELGTASGQPDAFGVYGIHLMTAREQQGRLGELVPLIADTVAQNPMLPTYKAVLSAAHLDAGDDVSARQVVEDAAAEAFYLPEDGAWFDGMVLYARVVIELELADFAERLIELLDPCRDQMLHDGYVSLPPVATFLGGLAAVIGRYDDAESYFAQAADLTVRGEMHYAKAFNDMLWGRMMRRRGGPGDADRARDLLSQAQQSAVARGYVLVERRAAAELSTRPDAEAAPGWQIGTRNTSQRQIFALDTGKPLDTPHNRY